MLHPLDHLSPHVSAWVLGTLMLLTILWSMLLSHIGQPLKTVEAPLGIVSFELAFTSTRSETIVRSWDAVRWNAKNSLRLDYAFIPLYSTTLALLCVLAAHSFQRHDWSGLSTLAAVLAWYQWVAGLLDMLENWALLRLLNSKPPFPPSLPWLAGWCAFFKFLLIILALVCFLVAVACSLVI
jgi:hypothetical protein